MMRLYKWDDYKIKAYNGEKYSLEVFDKYLNTSYTLYENNYETLYIKAKEEAIKGKRCSLYELKYEVLP